MENNMQMSIEVDQDFVAEYFDLLESMYTILAGADKQSEYSRRSVYHLSSKFIDKRSVHRHNRIMEGR